MLRKLIGKTTIEDGRAHISLLILRVSFGGMMLTHGWGKFQKVLSGNLAFVDPLGIGESFSLIMAVLAEFIGSIGLMLGFFTRLNAFLLAFTMFVAGFIQHIDDPFSKKEKALLYLIGFVILTILGAGKYSLDDRLNK